MAFEDRLGWVLRTHAGLKFDVDGGLCAASGPPPRVPVKWRSPGRGSDKLTRCDDGTNSPGRPLLAFRLPSGMRVSGPTPAGVQKPQ